MDEGEIRLWDMIHKKKGGGGEFKICTRMNTDKKYFHYAFHSPVYIRSDLILNRNCLHTQ